MGVCLDETKRIGLDVQTLAIHRMIDPEQQEIETYRTGPSGSISVAERRKSIHLVTCWKTGEVMENSNIEEKGSEANKELRLALFRSKFGGTPIRSFIDVPYSRGVISAHSIHPTAFSEFDVESLKRVAEIFSVGALRMEDMERLAVRNKELREARDELEQRVSERMAELEALNERLQKEAAERKRFEEELIRLERLRALGELAAGVSHNLNNILVGAILPAQLVQHMTDDLDILRETETILASMKRARDLVRRLHLSTRGVDEGPLQDVRVNDVIREAVQATRPRWKDEAEARGIVVAMVTELGDVPPIRGLTSRLYDIIVNLILNAVHAMPDGGTITIRTRSVEEGVLIMFSDTGIGMEEGVRRRVFEPFFTTKMDVGSGLGLSSAYAAISQWGGDIGVKSEPGKGATFTMRLPVWPQPVAQEKDPGQEGKCRMRRARLLVVDADEILVRMVSRLFERHYEVETTLDGRAALEMFAPGKYDVALIGLGMPGIPGDRLMREMHRSDPSLASVLITGWSLEDDDPRLSLFDFRFRKSSDEIGTLVDMVTQAVALHNQRAGKKI